MPSAKTKTAAPRRNKHYEKRLASILKAASKIIARDGFEGASVRKVAAEAKINLSNIYYYFKCKDEMLFELQKHAFTTLKNTLEERLIKVETPEARLKAVIENHFQFFSTNMNDLKVCSYEIGSLGGTYYKQILKIRQEYYKLVKDVVAENKTKSKRTDLNLATLYLFGSLNWIYMWYDPKKNSDIGKLSNQLLKIYLNGIKIS
ncbi:MAG: TetR/AcrR family transcriptional regulator [candidate division Zixibacteria bacterium]|nr:TetR/AcrR family transcriptional regulator [candidate division Zixibacteria bacterium]